MQVALKLIPDKEFFVGLLMAEGEDRDMLIDEIRSLVVLLSPVLGEIHTFLVSRSIPLRCVTTYVPKRAVYIWLARIN